MRKDPRSVIWTILAIELLNIEVVLDEDLGKSLDIERRLATGQTIPVGRKGHMSPWLRGIKIIPIPAAWETNRSGEAIRITVREALREACGLSIGAAMALPLELATGVPMLPSSDRNMALPVIMRNPWGTRFSRGQGYFDLFHTCSRCGGLASREHGSWNRSWHGSRAKASSSCSCPL